MLLVMNPYGYSGAIKGLSGSKLGQKKGAPKRPMGWRFGYGLYPV